MKKILCLGDSWTDPNYHSDHHGVEYGYKGLGIKTWAEYFDADILAQYGCSNDWIFDRFCRFHEQYDQVIIMWSEWHRVGIEGRAHSFTKSEDVFQDILKTPNYMYAVDKIRGKSAFQMQGPAMCGYMTREEEDIMGLKACRYLIERDFHPQVHGWPCFEEIGGFFGKTILMNHFKDKSWKIKQNPDGDGHPNAKGHQFLYEYIQKQISS